MCTKDRPGEVSYADLCLPSHSCWLAHLALWNHPKVINKKLIKSSKTSSSIPAASRVPNPFPRLCSRENPVSPLSPRSYISYLSPKPSPCWGRETAVLICLHTCQTHSLQRHVCLQNDKNACSTPSLAALWQAAERPPRRK